MFVDPQTVNAQSLPRTGSSLNEGTFRNGDSSHAFRVSHSIGKRARHVARYDFSKIASDPFTAGQNKRYSASAYLVIDAPLDGFTSAELVTVGAALMTNLTATTNTNLTKLVNGEA